jgi:hypothetical protein
MPLYPTIRGVDFGLHQMMHIPSTLGSMRSWQYDSAVSEIANSSSVNRLFAFNGSVQSKATGACRERVPMMERAGALNCLAACLHNGRNMFVVCVEEYEGRTAIT